MKTPLAGVLSLPSRLGLRPLLFVAGAAAAAAGAYYVFFYRFGDRQRRPTTEETTDTLRVQTEVITEDSGQLLVSPQYCGPVTVYRCPRQFLILQHCLKDVQSSFWTLRFSYVSWHNRDQQRICVRRHYVLLMRGAVTYSWWILTNDFFMSSSQCPIWYASAARITLAERVEGLLTRVASCAFTEHHVPKTSGGVQVTEVFYTHQSLIIGHDEWRDFARSWSEVLLCEPEPQDTPEAAGGSADVDREVPALHAYTRIKRIDNFPLKLIALRQAFTIILNNAECRKDVCETGRKILGDLGTLNARDLTAFQQAYDRLLALVQDPSCREGIEVELAQIGIHHFNFIDIVYEVVIFGVQCGVRPQICPMPGGFLDHLLVMISSFSASTEQSRPRAEQYRLMIQNAMMRLLEDIFALGESVYEHPESVAEAVWNLVVDQFDELLDRLKNIEPELF
ncbi:uncharacterized protein LOC118814079 [Colossoma macropomum]|uniref:uncharacterized protein LOC118814079 n=1 Tax=Colossoma macropomum TaxID=42526 RepID=UPI0018650AEC|nr:uncharacterized protein LOC118814079 [Colossoma macropomum]